MTENETQKWLERFEWDDSEETSEALTTICEALQEVQEYRTIGTIEGLKSMKENGAFTGVELAQLSSMQIRFKKYLEIGTVEEFKTLKEKSMAKKPFPKGTHKGIDNLYCPNCNHPLTNRHEQCELPYCDICGQRLDWSE